MKKSNFLNKIIASIIILTFISTSAGYPYEPVKSTLRIPLKFEKPASRGAAGQKLASNATLVTADSVPALLKNLEGVLRYIPTGEITILDEKKLVSETIDYLARECALNPNKDVKDTAKYIIRETALVLGIIPASLHSFYMARTQGRWWKNITVPTFNLRAGVYDEARDLFRVATDGNIGTFGLELARSEIRYTGQRPGEYAAICLAAAIKEGYRGQVFFIGDHYQINREKFMDGGEARDKEIVALKSLIREAILDGTFNIDLDPSTLVDEEALDQIVAIENQAVDSHLKIHPQLLEGLDEAGIKALRRKLVDEIELPPEQAAHLDELYQKMHATTTEVTMDFIRYIRGLEKELLDNRVTIGIGIEERHIDNPKHKNNPSTIRGTKTLAKNILAACKEEGLRQPCKMALQTGTMHGLGGKIDFGIYERHQAAAKDIGIDVFVQHGTSTIKDREDFKKLPLAGVGEAHLATEYQKIHLGVIASMMPDLAEKMGQFMEGLMDKDSKYDKKFRLAWNAAFNDEAQKGKSRHQVLVEMLSDTLPDVKSPLLDGKTLKGSLKDLVKEVSEPFKDRIWNVPENVKMVVSKALNQEFSEVTDMLNAVGTKNLVWMRGEPNMPDSRDAAEIHGRKPAALEASNLKLASNMTITSERGTAGSQVDIEKVREIASCLRRTGAQAKAKEIIDAEKKLIKIFFNTDDSSIRSCIIATFVLDGLKHDFPRVRAEAVKGLTKIASGVPETKDLIIKQLSNISDSDGKAVILKIKNPKKLGALKIFAIFLVSLGVIKSSFGQQKITFDPKPIMTIKPDAISMRYDLEYQDYVTLKDTLLFDIHGRKGNIINIAIKTDGNKVYYSSPIELALDGRNSLVMPLSNFNVPDGTKTKILVLTVSSEIKKKPTETVVIPIGKQWPPKFGITRYKPYIINGARVSGFYFASIFPGRPLVLSNLRSTDVLYLPCYITARNIKTATADTITVILQDQTGKSYKVNYPLSSVIGGLFDRKKKPPLFFDHTYAGDIAFRFFKEDYFEYNRYLGIEIPLSEFNLPPDCIITVIEVNTTGEEKVPAVLVVPHPLRGEWIPGMRGLNLNTQGINWSL